MTKQDILEIFNDINDVYNNPNKHDDLSKMLDILAQQEPCGKDINVPATDAISRQAVLNILDDMVKDYIKENDFDKAQSVAWVKVQKLPPVTPQPKTGHCKDCKHFEYDSSVKVDGAPLIVAHEICSKWGRGCKTREDGYCFLFESQESEGGKHGKTDHRRKSPKI